MDLHQTCHFQSLLSTRLPRLLVLLFFCYLCGVVHCQHQCPNHCGCLHDGFVSCDEFSEQTLRQLPKDVQTLILRRGNIRSFPHSFLRLFPKLSVLEIQSTEMEAIEDGAFSGVVGLNQLAIIECQVGDIKTGAFRGVENVSSVLISDSQIRTVYPGAFSAIRNVQELSILSSHIEEVGHRAFEDLSHIDTFTFSRNNVTSLPADAFHNVRNLGQVDMSENNFTSFQAAAMIPLTKASREISVSSNKVLCQCSSVQPFHRPEMLHLLHTQNCTVPETGETLRLSAVNVNQLCINQPTTPVAVTSKIKPSTIKQRTSTPDPDLEMHSSTGRFSPMSTYSTSDLSGIFETSSSYPALTRQTSPSGQTGGKNASKLPVSTSISHGSGDPDSTTGASTLPVFPEVTSIDVTNGVTINKVKTVSSSRNSGLSEDPSKTQNKAVSGKQTSFVLLLVPVITAWVLSVQRR